MDMEKPKKRKWEINFNTKKTNDLPAPLGYNPNVTIYKTEVVTDESLNRKKSWDLALEPLKQLPMNFVIMHMSGDTISIFPLIMIGMMFVRAIKSTFTNKNISNMQDGAQGIVQVCVYYLGNLVNAAVALCMCHRMGILPIYASDWLAFVEPPTRLEYYGGGVSFI